MIIKDLYNYLSTIDNLTIIQLSLKWQYSFYLQIYNFTLRNFPHLSYIKKYYKIKF